MPTTKKKLEEAVAEKEPVIAEEKDIISEKKAEKLAPEEGKVNKKEIEPKFKVGNIVYISKDADADLNGFKLFPQYKKYTYTVEAYDAKSDTYSLRRLNLSLKLKGELLVAPGERAHDSLNRRQF